MKPDETDYSKLTLDELLAGMRFATPENCPDLFQRGFRTFTRSGPTAPFREITTINTLDNTASPDANAGEPPTQTSSENSQAPDENGGRK